MKILLVGFGDIAARLAPRLTADGCQVSALRRSVIQDTGLTAWRGDCRDESLLAQAVAGQDVVVATLTPDRRSAQGYREAYEESAAALARVLASCTEPPQRVLWVSSSRVYGESEGEWVDELTPARPRDFAGHSLLAAEEILRQQLVPVSVVRFTGIYGPGRTRLIDQVRAGHCAPPLPQLWTNRIHSEDCAGVLHHLISCHRQRRLLASLYLASDCEPVPLHDVQGWLAQRLGVSVTALPEATVAASRRCSNRHLLDTGYCFQYPSWREGYESVLAALAQDSARSD